MATIVPFLRSQDEVAWFDQKVIDAMSKALDAVCRDLHLPEGDPAREVMAARIIDLARRGGHDPAKLRDRVIAEANGSRLAI
jgi:hypothetical protein